MRNFTFAIVVMGLIGCATPAQRATSDTHDAIQAELQKGIASKPGPASRDAVAEALLPPLRIEVPSARAPIEERFSLAFNNVPASQFFHGIVSGTRYSMLVHPDVQDPISVNLKDVTVMEALDAVRDMYGYDYQLDGSRIFIKSRSLQTRVFQVNYLATIRKGTSDIRVSSGSISDTSATPVPGAANGSATPGAAAAQTLNSSKISTESNSDFWAELTAALQTIVGTSEGRNVVISAKSGVVVVRAMWDELRNVSAFLKATQLAVDRQVILEAKIIEVELTDGFESGINWSAFRTGSNSAFGGGLLSPETLLQPLQAGVATLLSTRGLQALPGGGMLTPATNAGSLFGLAFQTSNFAALISFLESQGRVHVLSSPRIATMNNQKAVLKVGKDEFFVTNVSTTTQSTGTTSTTSPTVTVQPFFSGVALDVTPQIDDAGNIVLHIHPSVSNVTTVDKVLNLGSTIGVFNLPLASSTISETDSVVRGQDGQIVVIGGLMRQASVSDRSQLPAAGDIPGIGALFRNTRQSVQKRELVILLKPTIVQGNAAWAQDLTDVRERTKDLGAASRSNQ